MKNLRASTLIFSLALFVLIGGSATAASSLINGKQIKTGTITAKQISNRTITMAKISPAAIRSLRGQKGAQGPPGAPGLVSPLHAEADYLNLDKIVLLSLEVPAGQYMLTAKANLTSNDVNAYVDCAIWIDETSAVDEAISDPVGFNETVSLSLMSVSEVQGKIDFRCNGFDVAGNARDVKLIAVPVAG
jgi:hypothetical protein